MHGGRPAAPQPQPDVKALQAQVAALTAQVAALNLKAAQYSRAFAKCQQQRNDAQDRAAVDFANGQ